jgi:hypothetical protein
VEVVTSVSDYLLSSEKKREKEEEEEEMEEEETQFTLLRSGGGLGGQPLTKKSSKKSEMPSFTVIHLAAASLAAFLFGSLAVLGIYITKNFQIKMKIKILISFL